MPNEVDDRTFEIGLVMAGAVSAGAYTAGVCDFLIQALDAWESAKRDPVAKVPRHNIRIRALSGASAGAMTSAIAAVALGSEIDSVTNPDNPPAPMRNRLYDAWVRQVDISGLLGTSDIEATGQVVSLLDATPLETIAADALIAPRRGTRRPYVADPLAVMLTVANLRGVPYGFRLFGSGQDRLYGMSEHMDHMRFAVSWQGETQPNVTRLDPAEAPKGNWPKLADAALASGAFPGGLAPRRLDRPSSDYHGRHRRDPLFPETLESYRFLCVDGGLMDNEPLELARRYLSGGADRHNPRNGKDAHRCVVMIDPFPNEPSFDEHWEPDERLTAVARWMFRALKNQARFKPEELELAEHDDVYSRFMIAPSRRDERGHLAQPAMASEILGGFGGFFHESFRRHDFQLGRRNCQAFLRWHFCLPATNALYDGEESAVLDAFAVHEVDGTVSHFTDKDGREIPLMPIIPLVDEAAVEVEPMSMPTGDAVDVPVLERAVARRAKVVGQTIIRSDLSPLFGGTIRWIIEKAWNWRLVSNVTGKVMTEIRTELSRL